MLLAGEGWREERVGGVGSVLSLVGWRGRENGEGRLSMSVFG